MRTIWVTLQTSSPAISINEARFSSCSQREPTPYRIKLVSSTNYGCDSTVSGSRLCILVITWFLRFWIYPIFSLICYSGSTQTSQNNETYFGHFFRALNNLCQSLIPCQIYGDWWFLAKPIYFCQKRFTKQMGLPSNTFWNIWLLWHSKKSPY